MQTQSPPQGPAPATSRVKTGEACVLDEGVLKAGREPVPGGLPKETGAPPSL